MKSLVGVFWIYKSQIYFKATPRDTIKPINNFIDCDFSHYQVWDELSSHNKDFYLYEYEDIPRGRVVYDIKNEQYIVYSNHDIINSDKAKILILRAFHLQEAYTLFLYDAHYKIIQG